MTQSIGQRPYAMNARRTCTLFRNKDAASIARIFAEHFLLTLDQEGLVEDGQLCISELVGNAIRHTTTSLCVMNMYPNYESPLFEVWDNSFRMPKWPGVHGFRDLTAESGRGLQLIKTISADCGAYARDPINGGGKVVWFRL
jgi:hypothetical protein